jgi:hypothetical protein
MPINTDLNIDPYFDDFETAKQFYRVLFKPKFAVQARELTQLQTILQNQIEQFGDNIFKEGSIIRGCNFTELSDLRYVKVRDRAATSVVGQFDPTLYIGEVDGDTEIRYELEGQVSGLRANILFATRGFETRPPDLNTFYISYLNTNETQVKEFLPGELLNIKKIRFVNDVIQPVQSGDDPVETINVTNQIDHAGRSFGLRAAEGILFQRGHFLFADEQIVIVSKYTNFPDRVAVGYSIEERLVSYLQDPSLLDNANGYVNENAPGADRLKLVPILTAKTLAEAEADTQFFILSRYQNGNAVLLRDVSQFNVIGQEMARRTFEESGNYVARDFNVQITRESFANNDLTVAISPGVAYIQGFRVENVGDVFLTIDPIENTNFATNQPVSFEYGGFLKIQSITGTVPINNFSTISLRNSSNTEIGTALVKNITPERVYLFNVRIGSGNNFNDVTRIIGNGGFISVANNVILQDKGNAELIFDTGMFSLKDTTNISLPVRASGSLFNIDANTDTIEIVAAVGEDFDVDNTANDILVVDDSNTRILVDSITVSPNKQVLTVNLTSGQSPTANCTVYFNKRIQNAAPHSKLSREVYIKSSFSAGTRQYNLGFPDVYKIVSITDSAGNDVTSSFRLNTNQQDSYYDHSYVELLPGRTVPANGLMTIRMKVFQVNTTSGQAFFTIASYPVDVPAFEITTHAASNGRSYNLRDSFDFRPHVNPVAGADYDANTVGLAPTISPTINLPPAFSGSMLIPALNSTGNANYEYYLARRDVVTVDSYGNFAIVKGDESETPTPPFVSNELVVAELSIPGFPMLSPEEATVQNRPNFSVRTRKRGTRAYRMRDIENIDQKVEQIRYYVLLSQLEAATRNLNILDEDGRSRFKNGIIVDPFNDLTIADIRNAEFSAGFDFSERSLTPAIRSFPLNLVYKSNVSSTLYPSVNNARVATLQRDQNVVLLSQRYATNFRNCVSNFYSYQGQGFIFPEFDTAYDMVTNPLVLDIDIFGPINQLVENINEIIPLTRTDPILVADNSRQEVEVSGRTTNTFWVTDQVFTDVTRTLALNSTTETQDVGDFISNFSFRPHMASTEVRVYMSGLRPNTRHYFFFDRQDVNAAVAPGTPVEVLENINRNGAFGDPVITDDRGVLRAVFFIPEETFFVGDRRLEITDVDDYESIQSASTSYGFVTYRAYNFSIEKNSFSVTTRMPESTILESSTNRSVNDRVLTGSVTARRKDPLAQTFFIKDAMTTDTDVVFISAVDLFFKRKSEINGVTIMIRETVNGYPSSEILPFAKVHLTNAQVNVSDDATAVTTVSFPIPIRLDAEKEYAIVVEPDANDPDYLIYTSKVGGRDLIDGLPVVNDWGDGMLFTSTNNRAWQSYQDEDIKFNLYRHNFSASTGSVTLKNQDHEFLTISGSVGKFRVGEFVYVEIPLAGNTANTVSVIAGNNVITGTALSETYAVGDFILVDDGSDKGLFRITDVIGPNSLATDRPATFTSAGTGLPVVGGTLVHYDVRNPNSLVVVEGSSATANKLIQASDVLIGFDSEATAIIDSVDNINLSYLQPMIYRANDTFTRTSMTGRFTNADNVTLSFTKNVKFNDACNFSDTPMVLFSKSNDILGTRPFELTISMQNGGNPTTTPFIDIEISKIFAYQFKTTNDSATASKYVSKMVQLAENLDAEDFQIYVTAFRPRGTDVKVYLRAQNAYDPEPFNTADWVELEMVSGSATFSASNNIYDFREFVYRIPASSKDLDGVFTYTNSEGSEFTSFAKFAVKIELLAESVSRAPRVLDYRGIALT